MAPTLTLLASVKIRMEAVLKGKARDVAFLRAVFTRGEKAVWHSGVHTRGSTEMSYP